VATSLSIDETILDCIVQGTTEGLGMTGIEPPPVGASRFFSANRPISVIIGLVGKCNGTLMLNMSQRGMLPLASKLLMEDQLEVNEDAYDAVCEIGNMIAGCTKECLAQTSHEVPNISVPSLILSANYDIYYARGISTVSVEFELEEISAIYQRDRFFSVSASLLRQIA
jgi:CheY-specific phosphatase CheX